VWVGGAGNEPVFFWAIVGIAAAAAITVRRLLKRSMNEILGITTHQKKSKT
jgi:hypothetical protein